MKKTECTKGEKTENKNHGGFAMQVGERRNRKGERSIADEASRVNEECVEKPYPEKLRRHKKTKTTTRGEERKDVVQL